MASAARRKPKIRPPRKHGSSFSAEKTWSELATNIREIQNHDASNLSFEENYRFAYNMVLHKEGKMLYDGVNELVAENLDQLAREKVIPVFPTGVVDDPMHQNQEGELLLKGLRSIWDDHSANMARLRQILKYMDRVYTKTDHVPEIWDAGLHLFLKHIIRPPIQDHLVKAILKQIQFDRDGYGINHSPVKGCVDVFLNLDVDDTGVTVYKRDLEPAILRESEMFYKAEGAKWLEFCDAPEFLRRVENRLASEELRAHHYLSRQTAIPLRQILQDNLLTPHLSTIISLPNSGLDTMIDSDKDNMGNLARLYRLFTMVPTGLPCLKRSLKDSIANRGKEVNRLSLGTDGGDVDVEGDGAENGAENPSRKGKGKTRTPNSNAQTLSLALRWVQDVLDLKDKFDSIWKQAFNNDRELESALNEAFESFVNGNEKAPEFISLFIDDNLKKGLKGKDDTEIDAVLDKTITVFRFLTDKDVFERYYKSHLSKRLLHGRSVSDDAERGMLAKLKVECGYQFTQKLEGMFHDMKISADMMQTYRTHLEQTIPPKVELSVTVMTSGYWPISQSPSSCILPDELLETCKSFEQFYLSRHSGRRLTWQPSLGNADIRVSFKAKKIELNVSTFAMVILLLFSDLGEDDYLTYWEIKEGAGIVESELKRHLQSLACAKFKVLKKHPLGRDINTDDSFSFDHNFTSPMQKIKISTISSRVESGEERKETRDRIDEERKHQIEACVVRIMKDRKHMTHNDLMNEVTRQMASRFQPDPLNIKKRIEGLIEREYLERCEDRRSYNYLA